jgi:hypothetical protein
MTIDSNGLGQRRGGTFELMFVFVVAQEYLKGLEANWVIIDDEHVQHFWELIVHRCVLFPLYLVTCSYYSSWSIFFTPTWTDKPKQEKKNKNTQRKDTKPHVKTQEYHPRHPRTRDLSNPKNNGFLTVPQAGQSMGQTS